MAFKIWELLLRAPDDEGAGAAGAGSENATGSAGAGEGEETGGTGEGQADAGSGDGGAGGEGSAPAWPSDGFPPDWGERALKISGLNEDALEKAKLFLERRKSPADVLRSALSADTRITELTEEVKSRLKPPTGKGDKPEDLEAWNTALGIPKTVEEYKVWEDPQAPWLPEEKVMIGSALQVFHKEGVGQKGVDAALQVFRQVQADSLKQMQVQAMQVADKTKENLRIEYGTNFDAQMEMANRVAGEVFGKFIPKGSSVHELMSMPLAGGGTLGDSEPFVRGMIELGKLFGDHGQLETGMSDPKGLEQRRQEIHALQLTDPRAYSAAQDELIKITTALKKQGKVA